MKFSEEWLREWVNPSINSVQLAEQLTLLGLEVDSVKNVAGAFEFVVVGEVLERIQHPNADRLSVCKVNVGEVNPLSIVCGASNVRAGLKVAVAKIGAILPGDFRIKASKLRGEPSEGMLCSESELGLAQESEGILELAQDAPIGMDLRTYLNLEDVIIEIELTPNRGDCACLLGIAREIAAVNQMALQKPTYLSTPITHTEQKMVRVQDTKACPRYFGRVIKNINPQAVTPLFMQQRLLRSGIRPIHPVVDVTQYVMLALGQPMHAFDLQKLHGDLVVRGAKEAESLTLLDQQTITLGPNALVIADDQGPQALAGIMGGKASSVTAKTLDIFLESAHFSANALSLTARAHQLSSDAAYRFERGVDPLICEEALDYATQWIIAIAGGEVGPITSVDHFLPFLPKKITVSLTAIQQLLGIKIEEEMIASILKRLGYGVQPLLEGFEVTVPSYRSDVSIAETVIADIARVYGYDKIPETALSLQLKVPTIPESLVSNDAIAHYLVARDYHEVMVYSFVDPAWQALIAPIDERITLLNPLASSLSVMRTSLWPGLLQTAVYNQNRQNARQRLFEQGQCFYVKEDRWDYSERLALLVTGDVFLESWAAPAKAVDYYDVLGDVSALLGLTHDEKAFTWQTGTHLALHPGQCADLYFKGELIGYLGALHPKIAQQMNLNQVVWLFEVELSALREGTLPSYRPVSKYPTMRRDIALVMEAKIEVADLLRVVRQHAGDKLCDICIFDVYQGANLEPQQKSVALGLIFQDALRTLVDEEVNRAVQDVIANLQREFSITLRM